MENDKNERLRVRVQRKEVTKILACRQSHFIDIFKRQRPQGTSLLISVIKYSIQNDFKICQIVSYAIAFVMCRITY